VKITKHEAPIVVPPPTFTLELTEREAQSLRAICLLDATIPDKLRKGGWNVDVDAVRDLLQSINDTFHNAEVYAK